MTELLQALPAGAVILDLGCAAGSFHADRSAFLIVGLDIEPQPQHPAAFVQGDAAMLPFAAASFDVVISNHSLEHIQNLPRALAEIARVLKPGGGLYIAVPDAGTISDRLYRWLGRGGGHINAFRSARDLARQVQQATGLPCTAIRTLCTSLACLNRRNRRFPAPRRLLLLGGGAEISLVLLTYAFRLLDRAFSTRLSVYGWAFYFGNIAVPDNLRAWTNVCVYCGAGHPSDWLLHDLKVVRRNFLLSRYGCPACGTLNLFTDDSRYGHLQ